MTNDLIPAGDLPVQDTVDEPIGRQLMPLETDLSRGSRMRLNRMI